MFVGYRWYDSKAIPVLYPFGHGLSYTTFTMDGLRVASRGEADQLEVSVSVQVKNTGGRAGQEVVQVYVGQKTPAIPRPVRELKGFAKVQLEPGESHTVQITLDTGAFEYFDPEAGNWVFEPGEYSIEVGNSSQDLPLRESLRL